MSPMTGLSSKVLGNRLMVLQGPWILRFDQTGRFLSASGPGRAVRRGLDDRLVRTRTLPAAGLLGRRYEVLEAGEKPAFYRRVYSAALSSLASLPRDEARVWRDRLARWTPEALTTDREAFDNVYLPISILPPDQYHALVVQVTHGCSYNRCLFCDFYRDRRFHVKTPEELDRHLERLRAFMGRRIEERSGIFLGDGNAFVVPTARLIGMLEQIRRTLGDNVAGEFYTFMDTFTSEHKSPQGLRRIYDHGLRTVYTGLETGADRLRAFLRKPGTAREAVHVLNALKEVGFRLGVILLVGAGGPAFAEEHLDGTLEALRNLHLTSEDVIFLSPFMEPEDTDYERQARAAGLATFSEPETAGELRRWQQALAALPARITLYSIKEHLYF